MKGPIGRWAGLRGGGQGGPGVVGRNVGVWRGGCAAGARGAGAPQCEGGECAMKW